MPHVRRQHLPGGQADAGLLQQAGILGELLDGLFAEQDRKALLFSEWTTMLDLIEPLLARADWTSCGSTARCRRRSDRNW